MRTVVAALMVALVLALGTLEVLASRAVPPDYTPDPFAIWPAR